MKATACAAFAGRLDDSLRTENSLGLFPPPGTRSSASYVFYIMLSMTVERGNTPNAVVVQVPAERATVLGGF